MTSTATVVYASPKMAGKRSHGKKKFKGSPVKGALISAIVQVLKAYNLDRTSPGRVNKTKTSSRKKSPIKTMVVHRGSATKM